MFNLPAARETLVGLLLLTMLGCTQSALEREPVRSGSKDTVLPGEYERVSEVIIAWDSDPHLETFFADMVALASSQAPVTILLSSDQSIEWVSRVAAEFGADTSHLRLLEADVESVWVRDYGPLMVRDGETRRVVDFEYYGGFGDDEAPRFMAEEKWKVARVQVPLVLEGGNLLSNGAGLCLTTETIISANASRHGVDAIEDLLRQSLGCKKLMILQSLVGEPTGHVDMFATFSGPGEVIVGEIFEGDFENAGVLDENARLLEEAGITVRRIPMPGHEDGRFRSYTNALAINDIVIVPVYPEDIRYEELALDVFAEAYPERTILSIVASEIIEKAGAVHCVGMTVAQ